MRPGSVIPSMVDGGTWSSCFGLSWTDMMLYDQAVSQRMIRPGGQFLRKASGTMGVAASRSEIVRVFLDTDAEWLFMVDTDMGYAADTVDRLVKSAIDNECLVVGALAFALKSQRRPETELHAQRFRMAPTMYRYREVQGEKGFLPIETYTTNKFQWVDATGAACLLMHRDALAKLPPDPFRPMLVADALPNGEPREFSEDLSFCARLAQVEVGIGVDTSIKTTHHKGGLYLDEETYRQQRILRTGSPLGVKEKATA